MQDQNTTHRTFRTCDETAQNAHIVAINGTCDREAQSSLVGQPGRNGEQHNGGEPTYDRQMVRTSVTNVCSCHDNDDNCDDYGCVTTFNTTVSSVD